MYTENIIIGAGPAGLAMAARLKQAGLAYLIIEQSNKVASKWHQHYDRLHLHTVKEFSSLPYMDFPDAYPQYVSKFQLIDYYNDYVKQFGIEPMFNTTVTSIQKTDVGWEIKCDNDKLFTAKNVIVATGLNRIPRFPKWKGADATAIEISHAAQYKNTDRFIGKKVLVVGMGNTGAEIALDLAEHGIDVCIAVRGELVFVPRDFLGKSVQLTATKLDKLPWGIGDWIGSLSSYFAFGNLRKYGLPISSIKPAVLRRVYGKPPTIDIGTIAKIKEGKIKVHRDVDSLSEQEVIFKDGTVEQFDAIILATGYQAKIQDFLKDAEELLDENGEPKMKAGLGKQQGLYFIGYEKYTYGGGLGTLKSDSETILNKIIS